MTDAEDAELVARIGGGDVGAAAALYDRHAGALFPLALRIVRDRAEAEDVLHDAFVALAERAAQYERAKGSVIAWLVTLVRNLAIDRTRRRDRRGSLQREIIAFEPPAVVKDPEQLTDEVRERHRMQRALARLPEAQARTLSVAFFEGLTYPEIAEREGVPLGTIKSRAARALSALRAALAAEGLDEHPEHPGGGG
ncbi:MAG TPA: sigma-70 family RNA polymerase sigma factor [Polyangiaceae bacterium]|nr:sigma-70 family RNA polymerase sigma factor [Polyangiaceae bacterium]